MSAPHRVHAIPQPRRALYQLLFAAAAIYNLAVGLQLLIVPQFGFWLLGVDRALLGPLGMLFVRLSGVFVLMFALAYHYVARHPERFSAFIFIAMLGKIVAAVGFAIGYLYGAIPGRLGWSVLVNDLVWLPLFLPFVYETVIRRRYESR